ncbi:hypothetical protein RRG08_057148 [Elysia crispata]|uniref:Uncharacterized protein n=1 Tax=Elysia crispata TaxID=231223 RepID=A0AAE1E343_9GAST|nr:hypothetical protein RRG08_057148 [Elysia crispata]
MGLMMKVFVLVEHWCPVQSIPCRREKSSRNPATAFVLSFRVCPAGQAIATNLQLSQDSTQLNYSNRKSYFKSPVKARNVSQNSQLILRTVVGIVSNFVRLRRIIAPAYCEMFTSKHSSCAPNGTTSKLPYNVIVWSMLEQTERFTDNVSTPG